MQTRVCPRFEDKRPSSMSSSRRPASRSSFQPNPPSVMSARRGSQCGNDFLHLLPVHVWTFPFSDQPNGACRSSGGTGKETPMLANARLDEGSTAKLRQLQSSMRVSASEIVKRTLDLLHKEQCEGMGSRTRALLSSDFVGAHGPEDLPSSYKQLGTGAGRQAWFPVTLQVVSEGRLPQEAPRTLRSLDSTSRSSNPPCLRMARPPMR